MTLALDELSQDPEQLLQQLRKLAQVVAQQNAALAALQAERNAAVDQRDTARAEHDAAQAEIEKLKLLIRQLQRGQFGRRSERLDPDQLQLGLEDLEQTMAAAQAAGEMGAGLAVAGGDDLETVLGELATILRHVGREHGEALAVALAPAAGSA